MTPALDIAASRARILAPAVKAQGMGYRDNDMDDSTPRSIVPEMAATPAPAVRPSGFTDLDASPLELAGHVVPEAPVQVTSIAPVADTPPAQPDVPAPAAPAPAVPETKLTPAFMRRILYLATTSAGQEPAYGRCQANIDGHGLRYGLGRFTQSSGDLGRLLRAMHDADPAAFAKTFGPADDFPEADPQELIKVTNNLPAAAGGVGANLPQMQPASGKLVWSKEWVSRFKAAAKVPAFQAVQFKTTAQVYLLPLLPFAKALRLNSEKGLAIMAERAIQMGVEPALTAIVAAVSPLKTDAMRTAALARIAPGKTIAQFQKDETLDDVIGHIGLRTHVRILERLGMDPLPPVQLPDVDQMIRQIMDYFLPDKANSGLVLDLIRNAALKLDQIDVSAPDMGDTNGGGSTK